MSGRKFKNLEEFLQFRQQNQKTLVLVTGVFDVFHQEHKNFLTEAKKQGNLLLVALESDLRVRALKGPTRPINSQEKRLQTIANLGLADFLLILPEQFSSPEDHEAFIKKIHPNVLAVSASSPHLADKERILQKYGGTLKIVLGHNPSISSTQIIADRAKQKGQDG